MTSTRKKSTCSRSSATVSRSRELSAVCQPVVSSVRTRSMMTSTSAGVCGASSCAMSSRATRCCCRSSVRRVDSVGCAANTGSMLKPPSSATICSSEIPCPFSRSKQSCRPPGCGPASELTYCRRRRTRCTFSAMFTTWNQVEKARISSRASAGGRPCVRTTRATLSSASPSRRPIAAWRSPSTASNTAAPHWSRNTSPTRCPSACTSSRSAASLGGKNMPLRGMAGPKSYQQGS